MIALNQINKANIMINVTLDISDIWCSYCINWMVACKGQEVAVIKYFFQSPMMYQLPQQNPSHATLHIDALLKQNVYYNGCK